MNAVHEHLTSAELKVELVKGEPFIERRLVTVECAAKILAKNDGNRTVKPGKLGALERAMRENRWHPYSNDMIAVAPNGRLLNGQHRLAAIVNTGLAQPMTILWNCPESAYASMDRGSIRSPGDLFRSHKISKANDAAAFMRLVANYKAGESPGDVASDVVFEPEELIELWDTEPKRFELCLKASIPFTGIAPRTTIAMLRLVLAETWPDAIVDPWFEIAKPDYRGDAPSNNSARVFTQLLMNARARRRHYANVEVVAMGIKAFNAYVEGKAMKQLVWKKGLEPFPKIAKFRPGASRG